MKLLVTLTTLFLVGAYLAAAGVPTKVTYVHHDKVSATMAKGGPVIEDTGLRVLAQRRGSGEVEVHETTNHVFIIVEGEATFVTGGTLVGAKQTAPGQIRALGCSGRTGASPDEGRRDHRAGQDAALVQGRADEDGRVLRRQHGELIGIAIP